MNEFWKDTPISELARLQGVTSIESIDDLRTDFWPADESIDEMLEIIQSWRDLDETEWLQAAASNLAFQFLHDPSEDIYS